MTTLAATPEARIRRIRHHWIGGRPVPAQSDGQFPVVDPSTEQVIATVPAGSAADTGAAVAAAAAAQVSWAMTPLEERLAVLDAVVGALGDQVGALADLVTSEVGAPIRIARQSQVGLALGMAASFLGIARRRPFEERVGNSLVVYRPLGVAACITPWNVPLLMTMQKVVPALVAGCTVVHKPSELTPLSAYRVAEIATDAGLPAGVLNIVVGHGDVVGAELARHPDVDVVSLTGSTRAGRLVAALGATTLKHVHLELGGKSASVVLDDADLDRAVRATVEQVCFNTGQTCLQWSRLVVPRSRRDDALEIAVDALASFRVGDPRDPETDLGPLVSALARDRVRGHIDAGIAEGARLVVGGSAPPDGLDTGWYVRPTLFAGVEPTMRLAQEEIFGPVLSVMTHEGDDDAVAVANSTRYGLHGAVWAGTDERALTVARRLRTGQVDVNGGPFNPLAPFGGVRESGIGRECGSAGLDAFLETVSFQLPDPEAAVAGPRLRDVP